MAFVQNQNVYDFVYLYTFFSNKINLNKITDRMISFDDDDFIIIL